MFGMSCMIIGYVISYYVDDSTIGFWSPERRGKKSNLDPFMRALVMAAIASAEAITARIFFLNAIEHVDAVKAEIWKYRIL